MTDKTLAEKVAALNPGDEIRATCVYAGHTATLTGVAWDDAGRLRVFRQFVRWEDGSPTSDITDVEVLTPAEPPVGSIVECIDCGTRWHRVGISGRESWMAEGHPELGFHGWASVASTHIRGVKVVYTPEAAS